jgi:membrane protein
MSAAASSPASEPAPRHAAGGFFGAAKRAFTRFREQTMTDHAAALTYYAMMSLFPTLLVGATLLGLFGQESLVTDAGNYVARHGADENTAAVVRSLLRRLINSSGGALGITLIISLALALNGASGAFAAAGRALNVVFEVGEEEGFVAKKLRHVGATLAVIVLFLIVLIAVFLGGKITDDLFGKIGLGGSARTVWGIVRWPLALVAATVGYAMVYGLAPDFEKPRVRWFSPGAAIAVGLWIVLSIAFSIYVRNFSTYGAAYGALGAAIVLLLWLYLSANAMLFGAELNAELNRGTGQAEDPAKQDGGD